MYSTSSYLSYWLKKNQSAPRPSEHPPVRGQNLKTFRWDHRLQIQNLLSHLNGFLYGSNIGCCRTVAAVSFYNLDFRSRQQSGQRWLTNFPRGISSDCSPAEGWGSKAFPTALRVAAPVKCGSTLLSPASPPLTLQLSNQAPQQHFIPKV